METRSTGLNIKLPLSLSMQLTRRVADLRESGATITKEKLLLLYCERGLKDDAPGESMPVKDTQAR
jgi:hypothetical protein